MKKTIVVFLTFVLLLTQLTSMTYPTETDSSSISNDVIVSASARSPYEKIHVYIHPYDENDYSCIKNESELSAALYALKNYTESLAVTKTLEEEQPNIRVTVEFESGFSETNEFILFQKRFNEAKSIAEVRQIRKELNAFSKKYHSALIRSNISLLKTLSYNQIEEIGYSPFVVLDTTFESIESTDLLSLSSNHTVMNISLESIPDLSESEVVDDINTAAIVTSSADYGSECTATWEEVLTYIGAKSVVENGIYKGEGIIIGVLDSQVCDTTNENLDDKDIVNISGSTNTAEHATIVTSIIALIAPEATIVCDKRRANVSIASFIENNCDIVNISQNYGYNSTYSPTVDGLIDYQVHHHRVAVVKSSGNLGQVSNYVNSPGRGYNVITVGGVTKTQSGHIIHDPGSCYNKNEDYVKPNVCGIHDLFIPNNPWGNISISGTSFATPQVTACVALLLEIFIRRDGIWLQPYQVMSLVMSGAEETDDYTYMNSLYNRLDRRVGAGVINLDNSASPGAFVTETYSAYANAHSVIYSKQIYLEAGEMLQVVDVLNVPAIRLVVDGTETGNPSTYIGYELYLYSVSEQIYVSYTLTMPVVNYDLLRYVATTSGEYIIEIKASQTQTTTPRWFGLSYTIR